MNKDLELNNLARLSGWAAREFKEARQGFETKFEENGLDHLEAAMKFVEEIFSLIGKPPYNKPLTHKRDIGSRD